MAAITEQKPRPTYIQMCIIHTEQKLADLEAIRAHCIAGTPEHSFIVRIIQSHKLCLETIRIAEMECSQQIHEIERLL